MIGFSAFSLSIVGLRLPFPLFVIVLVLSLSCLVRLLKSVPAAVEDVLLTLCKAEDSVLPPLGEELRPDHLLLGRRRTSMTKIGIYKFMCHYEESGMIFHTPGSGKASKFTADAKKIIEEQMERTTRQQA